MVGGTWESGDGSGSGTWEFNNGTIEFWGTGSFSPSGTAPWADYIPDAVEAIVHEGITSLGSGLGALSNVVTLTLPDGLETIHGLAFFLCSSLRELVIPDSVTLIGSESSGLLSNVLPSSGVLERIVIGSGVQRIGGNAFSSCPSVKEIVFRGPMPEFLGYTFIGSTLNYNNFSLGTSEAPANVIVYTKGWGSDEVFTTAIRGDYTTFEYRVLSLTPSVIPVKAEGLWCKARYKVNVGGTWFEKVLAHVKVQGEWYPIGSSYEPPQYSLIMDANGGSGTIEALTGRKVTVPSNSFTRSGYAFVGWNTKADGSGTTYSAGQTITLASNMTLYAIWIRQYTITFAANGGTGTVDTIVTTSTSISLPSNGFSRSGYRFDRWNAAADGSGASYAEGQTISLTGDMTLYAIWVQQVTVTYFKTWNAENSTIYPPASNSGPIGDYLDLKVGNVTVPNLSDNFTASGNNSPRRTLTVDKGTSLYVMCNHYIGSGKCEVWKDGTRIAGPTTKIEYSLPNGIQSNVEIQMIWEMDLILSSVPTQSYWRIGISGGS